MRYALIALLFSACCSVPRAPALPVVVQATTAGFNQEQFNQTVRALQEKAGLDDTVVIVMQQIDGPYWGRTSWVQDHYQILIEVRQPHQGVMDTLIHEWAHAMVWWASREDPPPHDALWGVAYARAYRAAMEGPSPERAGPQEEATSQGPAADGRLEAALLECNGSEER